MSSVTHQIPCNPRFKGIENFLRRIAFNLGNTPSQTEVKVISCIPIDVTDLQQRIISLEKELCETQAQVCNGRPGQTSKNDKHVIENQNTLVNTALCSSPFTEQSSGISLYCKPQDQFNEVQNVPLHCSSSSAARSQKKSQIYSSHRCPKIEAVQTSVCGSCDSSNNITTKASQALNRCKNIFRSRKLKKCNEKYSPNTQFVYYAQTPNNNFTAKLENNVLTSTEILCRTHLKNVVKKQYDPKTVVHEFSDTSNFTAPICRDIGEELNHPSNYGSDACSCCHGKFQNIDDYMTYVPNSYDNNIFLKANKRLSNTYTHDNSCDYDLIPVKENSIKKLNKKLTTADNGCWPEKLRTKHYYHPFIVNYQTEYPKKRQPVPRSPPKLELTKIIKPKKNDDFEHISKNCSFECSQVYKKYAVAKSIIPTSKPVKVIVLKNELTSTNDIENQQKSTQNVSVNFNANENTESTLGQVKAMLQKVLEEVKTGVKLNNKMEETTKKDAIVQKSLNNIRGSSQSTLLHSYTYNNSYSVHPNVPSCSPQIPQQYCSSSMPYQPVRLQNYPIFIHSTPRKNMCMCCYKNNMSKQMNTGTNVDKGTQPTSCNETDKLIKEIYKSMAINVDNVDVTTKGVSQSECGDVKSVDGSTNTSWKDIISKKNTEMYKDKRSIEIETLMTSFASNSHDSKFDYSTSTQSRRKPIESQYNINNKNMSRDPKIVSYYKQENDNTTIVEEESTEDEVESDSTVINHFEEEKKQKKSLFQRVFKRVKLFNTKKPDQRRSPEDLGSDSDDYETIYSRQSVITPSRKLNVNRTNYSRSRHWHEKKQKIPYLEQEYRRHWNETLMFKDPNPSLAERNFAQNCRRTPYWTNYEARSVMVDNTPKMNLRQPSHLTMPKNITTKDKLRWLKKHKLGLKCGPQWKSFILEN